MSHGAPALNALLDRWPDTDAVMCVSDMSAFGAIMQCQRRGLNVPGDIAVAGFGNFELAASCYPSITTVSVDAHGIGVHTGEALLAALHALAGAAESSRNGRYSEAMGETVRQTTNAPMRTTAGAAQKHIKIDYAVIPRESA
jgi:DNA-binding LacI/PurR family transcriptional regulator